MAHFAKINSQNIVEDVFVIHELLFSNINPLWIYRLWLLSLIIYPHELINEKISHPIKQIRKEDILYSCVLIKGIKIMIFLIHWCGLINNTKDLIIIYFIKII